MRTKILKLKMILFALVVFAAGCIVNQEEQKPTIDENLFSFLDKAPKVLVEKEKLPDWLISIVELYEGGGELGIQTPLQVSRGIWNEREIYYLYSPIYNCPLCQIYYENGEGIVWSGDGADFNNFRSTSKNWVLIYQVAPEFFNRIQ